MKILIFILILLFTVKWSHAEIIPLRDPVSGDTRPGWWVDLWFGHIVVIEGIIEWDEGQPPEIQIHADQEKLESSVGEKSAELFESFNKFRIGRLKPERLLFASPGINFWSPNIKGIAKGESKDMQFLLPVIESDDVRIKINNYGNGKRGVYIFQYGSAMSAIPMIFRASIPADGMESANAVFAHRTRFDYHGSNNKKKENKAEMATPRKPSD